MRISAIVADDPETFIVGFKVRESEYRGSRFPVASATGQPRCWLRVGYRLRMDPAGENLMVDASYGSAYAADDGESTLCRFDYERDTQGYPEAHLPIYGKSPALAEWSGNPDGNSSGCISP